MSTSIFQELYINIQYYHYYGKYYQLVFVCVSNKIIMTTQAMLELNITTTIMVRYINTLAMFIITWHSYWI